MTGQMAVNREETKWVGKSIVRKDGRGKVTGETKFFSDMALPNMLYAKVAAANTRTR